MLRSFYGRTEAKSMLDFIKNIDVLIVPECLFNTFVLNLFSSEITLHFILNQFTNCEKSSSE